MHTDGCRLYLATASLELRQRIRDSVCLTRTHLCAPISNAFSSGCSQPMLMPAVHLGPWEGPPLSLTEGPFFECSPQEGPGKQTCYAHLGLLFHRKRLVSGSPTPLTLVRGEGNGLLSKAKPEVGLSAGPRHASPSCLCASSPSAGLSLRGPASREMPVIRRKIGP